MSLRYIDRQGVEIDAFLWRDLYDDPSYAELLRMEAQGVVVSCDWIGVWVSSREPKPRPFLVETFRPGSKASATATMIYSEWATTEEAAIDLWQDACREYLGNNPKTCRGK